MATSPQMPVGSEQQPVKSQPDKMLSKSIGFARVAKMQHSMARENSPVLPIRNKASILPSIYV